MPMATTSNVVKASGIAPHIVAHRTAGHNILRQVSCKHQAIITRFLLPGVPGLAGPYRTPVLGKEDSYERNPSGVSFVFNHRILPPGALHPGRSPPPQRRNPRAPGRICFRGGRAYVPAPPCGPGATGEARAGTAAARDQAKEDHSAGPGKGAAPIPAAGALGGPRPANYSPPSGDGPGQAKGCPPHPGRQKRPQRPHSRHGGNGQTARRAARRAPRPGPPDCPEPGRGGCAPRASGGGEN